MIGISKYMIIKIRIVSTKHRNEAFGAIIGNSILHYRKTARKEICIENIKENG